MRMTRNSPRLNKTFSRFLDLFWPARPKDYPVSLYARAALDLNTDRQQIHYWLFPADGKCSIPPERLRDMVHYARSRGTAALAVANEIESQLAEKEARKKAAVGFVVIKERDGPGSIPRCGRAHHKARRKKTLNKINPLTKM